MPAYRISAEADIRDAVVARLRERRAAARIIHEINVSTYGPNRIDLVAVDACEIVAVEIKSAKDKLDRLPMQIESMRKVAHHVVVALHEKFLIEQETNVFSAHSERDGKHYLMNLGYDSLALWRMPEQRLEHALPQGALDMLWRAELYALCGALRVSVGRTADMPSMATALRWHCNGKELTRGICALLRSRRCPEADPEIVGERIAA